MRKSCGIRGSVRRLIVAALGTAALSLIWTTAAFAQAPGLLGSGSGSGSDSSSGSGGNPVENVANGGPQTVAPVVQAAAPVVQADAAPVAHGTAPAAQPAAPVTQPVAQVTAPVVQTVAPVVSTVSAPVAEVTAPVVQTAAAVVNAVTEPLAPVTAPLVQAVAPVVQAAAPILETAAPVVDPLTEGLAGGSAPLLGGNDDELLGPGSLLAVVTSPESLGGSPVMPAPLAAASVVPVSTAGDTPSSSDASPQAPVVAAGAIESGGTASWRPRTADRFTRGHADRQRGVATPIELPAALPHTWPGSTSGTVMSGPDASKGTKARPLSPPGPSTPSVPSVPSSAAAVFSGSGASIFVAALVAALLLAVPGLSRRLRLELAPWPLPIALPSLERPG
jgi:hypothetical protein